MSGEKNIRKDLQVDFRHPLLNWKMEMADQRVLDALEALAVHLKASSEVHATITACSTEFYNSKPNFIGTINQQNIKSYGKQFGLSNPNDDLLLFDLSDYEGYRIARKFCEWMSNKMQSENENKINVSSIGEFYDDNRDCPRKVTKKIKKYGALYGLSISGDYIYLQVNRSSKRILSFDPHSGTPIFDQDVPFSIDESDDDNQSYNEQTTLIQLLPVHIQQAISEFMETQCNTIQPNELVLDLNRPLALYYSSIVNNDIEATRKMERWDIAVSRSDLDHILKMLKDLSVEFSSDNRCGIPGTLHRISRRLNRTTKVIGFTMRFGQMVKGSTRMITDLVKQRKSILLIGVPGVGKTTLLRELARVLSLDGVKVEIVDTSNEIAGEGDELHSSIGYARRLMVMDRRMQHNVMIEAVQNHSPDCIIIDEIGTKKEAAAASDITQRGVKIIGTVHGASLKQIIENPELNGLVGGVTTVTLGDQEASRRDSRKSVAERVRPCAFDCAIELRSIHSWVIYQDLTSAVDFILQKKPLVLEVRKYNPVLKQLTVEEHEKYLLF